MTQGQIQLGKQGLTDNFILTLRNHFKKYDNMKVKILKSAGHDKEKVEEYKDEILEKLGKKYTARILGFSIFIKQWRKPVRE